MEEDFPSGCFHPDSCSESQHVYQPGRKRQWVRPQPAERRSGQQLLDPDAFRSRLEEDFICWVWREERGKYFKKPSRCTGDAAKVLLKSDAAFEHLPVISFLTSS